MSHYSKMVASSISFSLLFGSLASVTAYITRIVLARKLTAEDFGLFFAVYTFVMFLLFFRDLGLVQALVKYIAEFKTLQKFNLVKTAIYSTVVFQLISSAILALILTAISPWLTENYFKNPLAKPILFLLIIYIFTSVFFLVIKSTFQGLKKMLLFSSMEFVKNLLVIGLILIFFKLGFTTLSPAIAFALVCLIISLIYLPIMLKHFNVLNVQVIDFKIVSKKLLLFGIPIFATALAGKFIGNLDTLMLTHFRSLEEVGVYNVVLPTALMILLIGVIFYIPASVNSTILSGIGLPKTVAKITFIAAIANIILNIIFIPRFGITAAAATTAISYFLMYVQSSFELNKIIKVKISFNYLLKVVLALLLFYLMALTIVNELNLNQWLEMLISFITALFSYAIFLNITNLYNLDDFKNDLKYLRK